LLILLKVNIPFHIRYIDVKGLIIVVGKCEFCKVNTVQTRGTGPDQRLIHAQQMGKEQWHHYQLISSSDIIGEI